jgi:hypothetical protein
VLRPGGTWIVAVPGPGDLEELRAACLAAAPPLGGLERVVGELAGRFELVERCVVRESADLDAAGLRDLAAATYRLARARERERLLALERLSVTSVHEVGVFRALARAA